MTNSTTQNMALCNHDNVQAFILDTMTTSVEDNEMILKLMAKSFEASTNTQNKLCGLFVLIDQMIHKYQKSPHGSNKQLKMIDTLLQRSQRTHVKVLPPQNIDMQVFVQKMIANAENIEQEPSTHEPIIRKCAKSVKEAFQAFFSMLKQKVSQLFSHNREYNLQSLWQNLDCFSEIHELSLKFMHSFFNFTYLFYQETMGRLLKLNADQVNGRLNNSAQFLCAKAFV